MSYRTSYEVVRSAFLATAMLIVVKVRYDDKVRGGPVFMERGVFVDRQINKKA